MTGYEMFEDVKQYMDFGPPGVEVHCLHGDTIPTLEKYACFIISYLTVYIFLLLLFLGWFMILVNFQLNIPS